MNTRTNEHAHGVSRPAHIPIRLRLPAWSRLSAATVALGRADDGAALVEYVLLVALLAVVCAGAVTLLGTNAAAKIGTTSDALK